MPPSPPSQTQTHRPAADWSLGQRRLHWLLAGLLVIMLGLGTYTVTLPVDAANKQWALMVHQLLGIVVLVLACLRLHWRRIRPRPSYPQPLPAWEARLAAWVQGMLYLLVLVLPLLGIMLSLTDPFVWPLQKTHHPVSDMRADWSEYFHHLHYLGAWLLLVLVTGHIIGALRHLFGSQAGPWRRRVRWRR